MTKASKAANANDPAKTRRAYKACLHCRSRKAKCDLGSIDNPSKPPCARCRRERRECIFPPSFRGGNTQRKAKSSNDGDDGGHDQEDTEMSPVSVEGPSLRPANNATHARPATHINEAYGDTSEMDDEPDDPPHKTLRLNSPSPLSHSDLDPQSLAAASLRNPTDALNLLALAADVDRARKRRPVRSGSDDFRAEQADRSSNETEYEPPRPGLRQTGSLSDDTLDGDGDVGAAVGHSSLSDYELIRTGALTIDELTRLASLFFAQVHVVFPMIPYHRIPRTEQQLACFAKDDCHLLTAIIVIASRQDKKLDIHEKSWNYMQTLINELILGKVGTVGAVEALLLLSENLPRRREPATEDEEHRMAWMLVGMAVRLGYMLGLDQKTLRPSSADDNEDLTNETLDREQLAWTYCYIFDRSISIRSGKAFWSRGPGLCFQRTHRGSMPNAIESFPSMRPIPGVQDDFASMLQAYTELTQTMASAHDVLYPSKDRTIALVRVGDYHKYLDEFTRSINGFRVNWEGQQWETFPITECVWITFHYLRVYIYAFAFQAHVQRSTTTTPSGKKVADAVIFPRGPMGSPDARFILEAIDAATELLKVCVNVLDPKGGMLYLPWRFYLFFSYAGVFLLKAVFVEAVMPADRRSIVQLIKQLIVCLARAGSDDQHPGVRYARLLNGLLRVFSRGQDGVQSRASSPKWRHRRAHPHMVASGVVGAAATTQGSNTASGPPAATNDVPMCGAPILAPRYGTAEVHKVEERVVDLTSDKAGQQNLQLPTSATVVGLSNSTESAHNAYYVPVHNRVSNTAQSAPHMHHSAQTHAYTTNSYTTANTNEVQPVPQTHPQQMYATPVATPNPTVYGPQPPAGYVQYQQQQNGSPPFQFDLNWPPVEVDGLTHLLTDEHSLDGDFWMSLPNHAQWPTPWPVGPPGTSSVPVIPMNGRQGM